MRTIGLISILGVLAGCTSLECDPGFHVEGDACVPDGMTDGGEDDAGSDGGDGDDAGTDAPMACGGACMGATPHCDTDTDTCVACLDASHCDESAPVCGAGGVCGPCTGPADCSEYPDAPVCGDSGAADGTCVACAGDADCTDADAGKCDTATNACVPCDDSDQCTEDGAGVCDMTGESGVCVECTVDDESACGGNSCHPTTQTCTGTALGSVRLCESCAADSECPTNARCVPLQFMAADRGTYCLTDRDSAGGCERPFAATLTGRTTASGVEERRFCGPNEALVTCEAVRALLDDAMCPGGMDEECPMSGLCESVDGLANRCTYACSDPTQCKAPPSAGNTCGDTAPNDYCGGGS